MKILRNPARERWLLDQIRSSFGPQGRDGIHLSDLLNVRKAYWQRILPIPPTDTEIQYFLAGRGHEDALGRVAGLLVTEQKVKDGISYRPDFTLDDVPAEMKTRRSNLAKSGEEAYVYETYLEQLRGYCALERLRQGVLIVFSLLEGRSNDPLKPTAPELAVYEIEFTEAELELERQQLAERRVLLEAALVAAAQRDGVLPAPEVHAGLPLCKDWMCGKPQKRVDHPARCVECDKEFSSSRYADSHTTTKTGAGHTVEPEIAHWDYVPRCKWHALCRPFDVDPSRGAR